MWQLDNHLTTFYDQPISERQEIKLKRSKVNKDNSVKILTNK